MGLMFPFLMFCICGSIVYVVVMFQTHQHKLKEPQRERHMSSLQVHHSLFQENCHPCPTQQILLADQRKTQKSGRRFNQGQKN